MKEGERVAISRNAKDILLKALAESLGGDALAWMGAPGVEVVEAIPTEMDTVEIRQEFLDTGFKTTSGELWHVEYQTAKEPDLYRFLVYDAHLARKYRMPVRTIVLYTRNVRNAPHVLDAGGIRYQVINEYLKSRDGLAALRRMEKHMKAGQWTVEDRLDLAFLPYLDHPGMTEQEALSRSVEVMLNLPSSQERDYVTALLLGISGRLLSEEEQGRLKEALGMTDLVKEIEARAEARGEARAEARTIETVVRNMLKKGLDLTEIMELTGLSQEKIEAIRQQMRD